MSTGYAVDWNSTPRSRSVFAITVNKEAKVHLDQGLGISISIEISITIEISIRIGMQRSSHTDHLMGMELYFFSSCMEGHSDLMMFDAK